MNGINIPQDKKGRIIDAGMAVFAKHGYKKAAMDEIVKQAGISKGLIFHYFGNKKNLFAYLFEYAGDFVYEEIMQNLDLEELDIFRKIRQAVTIKVAVMGRHPHLMEFLAKVYYEKHPDIDEIKAGKLAGRQFNLLEFLTQTDPALFRAGVDPQKAVKVVIWTAVGYSEALDLSPGFSIDDLTKDFDQYLSMLKKAFYKDEY